MIGLDLFTGIGGITLGLSPWVVPVAYCEIDPYCQGVLLSNMAKQLLPKAPIWNNIRTMSGNSLPREIDIIYGGFPCQDISCAGRGKGLEGERSGLFFEIMRLAEEVQPRFIFLENVPAITTRGGLRVVREIAEMGYDCRWCVISAASIGALHKRERWFLLGYSNSKSSQQADQKAKPDTSVKTAWRGSAGQCWPFASREHWQETVSQMGKCSDGLSNHVDRLKCLGNAVVPQQVEKAFKILSGASF